MTIFPIQDISVNVYPRLSDGVPRIDFWWNPDRYTDDEIAMHVARLELAFDGLVTAEPGVRLSSIEVLEAGERARLDRWSNRDVLEVVGPVPVSV
ncbi:hypothetical protein, partial [Mycobacterium stomatepiae]|uniref:hypothetical protein n=1 Tax=Mycobacterium stomatepiae TaxID=470076 RepID=UPI0021F27F26